MKDYKKVMSFFADKNIFPHIRTDNIKELISNDNVILENDVLITYQVYKKKTSLGNVFAEKYDVILHQIVNKKIGSGAAEIVIKRFFDYVKSNVFLTVRSENKQACKFYEKVGMKEIGKIAWGSDKNISGKVFVKTTTNPLMWRLRTQQHYIFNYLFYNRPIYDDLRRSGGLLSVNWYDDYRKDGRLNINKFIKEYSSVNFRLPTPKNKLYNGTIFNTLEDAIKESRNWDMKVSITLEENGYYRFFGHGTKVY